MKKVILILFYCILIGCNQNKEVIPADEYKTYVRSNLNETFRHEVKVNITKMTFERRTSDGDFYKGNISKAAKISSNEAQDYVLHIKQKRQSCEYDWMETDETELMEFSFFNEVDGFTLQECN
ncbi:hypothetical protein [Flammeovirga sp. SubArs3]|uniref:hypothetical protein n=1 Tax=Flammeovirga sp. SubArs3 TaxID=2995316 RepID=UPI00248C3986|nr:hypothetical protein [Flammeovirga sp. SubArs3]